MATNTPKFQQVAIPKAVGSGGRDINLASQLLNQGIGAFQNIASDQMKRLSSEMDEMDNVKLSQMTQMLDTFDSSEALAEATSSGYFDDMLSTMRGSTRLKAQDRMKSQLDRLDTKEYQQWDREQREGAFNLEKDKFNQSKAEFTHRSKIDLANLTMAQKNHSMNVEDYDRKVNSINESTNLVSSYFDNMQASRQAYDKLLEDYGHYIVDGVWQTQDMDADDLKAIQEINHRISGNTFNMSGAMLTAAEKISDPTIRAETIAYLNSAMELSITGDARQQEEDRKRNASLVQSLGLESNIFYQAEQNPFDTQAREDLIQTVKDKPEELHLVQRFIQKLGTDGTLMYDIGNGEKVKIPVDPTLARALITSDNSTNKWLYNIRRAHTDFEKAYIAAFKNQAAKSNLSLTEQANNMNEYKLRQGAVSARGGFLTGLNGLSTALEVESLQRTNKATRDANNKFFTEKGQKLVDDVSKLLYDPKLTAEDKSKLEDIQLNVPLGIRFDESLATYEKIKNKRPTQNNSAINFGLIR